MQTILHILTRPEDELTHTLIAGQRAKPETTVEVIDLNSAPADYDALVEKIFAADSIAVW
jgi:hypothetical protein